MLIILVLFTLISTEIVYATYLVNADQHTYAKNLDKIPQHKSEFFHSHRFRFCGIFVTYIVGYDI